MVRGLNKVEKLKAAVEQQITLDQALMNETSRGNLHAMKLLLGNGADINGRNDKGELFLYVAAKNKRVEAIRLLISEGACIEWSNDQDARMIFAALEVGGLSHEQARNLGDDKRQRDSRINSCVVSPK